MDDVAEKARRNLLMVSAGILAVWALGIPLDGKLVGAVDLSSVEPWRAWATATAVLLYFSLRHYFAPATHLAWVEWANRRKKWYRVEREKLLDRCAPSHHPVATGQTGPKDRRILFEDPNLPTGQAWKVATTRNVIWKRRKGSMTVLWDRHAPGVMIVTLSGTQADHVSQVAFTMRRRTYFWLITRSWLQAYQPSWRLLELSFPWALAFGAVVICVCKLGASLYYEFPFIRQLLSA